MSLVLQSIYNSIAWCCSKGPSADSRYGPQDEDEEEYHHDPSSEREAIDGETSHLIRTSLKDRIDDYQKATKQNDATGKAPTPYKRQRSTSSMIEHFESMVEESLSSSSHHMRTPLLDSSNHNHHDRNHEPATARNAIQANIRKSNQNLPLCAVCLDSIYPTEATVHSFGKVLHPACFACRLCNAKLKHHPLEVQFELPQGLYCVCAKCQFESMHRDKPKVLATVAGEKITPDADELGDVQGVKSAIGDELEEILLEKTVPRCQVCAGDFLNYKGRLCLIGQMKYHQECWETGKPSANLSERTLIPYRAAKYLPERWIVRLVMDVEDGTIKRRPIATLFFVWKTRVQDFQKLVADELLTSKATIEIRLELDDQAVGNPNYQDASRRKTRAQLTSSSAAQTLQCELIGNPLCTSAYTCARADKRDHILLRLQAVKYQVDHAVTLRLPKQDRQTLDLTRAQLSIVLQQAESK